MLTLNLNDSTLWNSVWQLDVLASSTSDSGSNSEKDYAPIPPQVCPIVLHQPVLAISVINPLGKPRWFSAGFLIQKIRTPLIVGANFDTHVQSRSILLGQVQLVSFLDVKTADYAVVFQPRFWHRQISLIMWEYQGTIEEN
ncbi:hypothetical protein QUB56_35095 [Microcoleus sp. AR_TQ3_B6]|uniref:hypothetical protein n=1 Tax=Microcoleus sp. AR_TQ3_B6 TaxID=3055284 RepID=UPI002FD6E831